MLKYFGFPEFDDNFIKELKNKIPKVIAHKLTYEEEVGEADVNWRNDAGEKATRIWNLWCKITLPNRYIG